MKINVIKKDIHTKLKLISYVLTGRISVYENVTLIADNDGLTLYATDGSISIFATVGAKIIESGIVSVNGMRLKEIIGTYPEDVVMLEVVKDGLNITSGGFQNILYKTPDNLIPNIPTADYSEIKLVENIAKLSWAEYIHFADNKFVGINDIKHRSQMGEVVNTNLVANVVVPRMAINLLERLDKQPCQVNITDSVLTVKQNDYVVMAGLEIPAKFDYSGVIPTKLNRWVAAPNELINAITNVGKFTNEVIVSFNEGEINIRGNNDKVGGADITLNTTGKGQANFKVYASDFIGAIGRTGIKLGVSDTGAVTLIGKDYTEVIAPIKL